LNGVFLRAEFLAYRTESNSSPLLIAEIKMSHKVTEDIEYLNHDDPNWLFTFDLGLSASLISAGFSLVAIDRKNLSKAQFCFRRAEGMDKAINAYWDNTLDVKARTYFDTLKMLKNRLHSE